MGDQSKSYRQLEIDLARANARIADLEKGRLPPGQADISAADVVGLLDLVPIPIWIAHDPHCYLVTGNRAASQLSGIDSGANVSQTPPTGQEVPRVRHRRGGRDLRPEEMPLQYAVAHGKEVAGIELDLVLPDGTVKHVVGNAAPLFDAEGRVRGGIAFYLDLTSHMRSQEALLESERRYGRLFEDASLGIFQSTAEGKLIRANPAYAKMFGYDSSEQARELMNDIAHQIYVYPDRRADIVRMIMESRGPVVVENLYKRKDGSSFIGSLHAWVVYDEKGGFSRLEGFVEDITDRKRAEDALRSSEEKYRALVETTDTGFVILDPEGKVLDANAEYVRLSGHKTLEEIRGRRVTEWTAGHDLARNAEEVRKCVACGFVRDLAMDYVDRDGRHTPIEINATVLQTDGSARIITLCRDVTERRRAAEALQAANERLRSVLESITDSYVAMDYQWRFLEINPAAEKTIFHRPAGELIGKVLWEEYPQLVGTELHRQYLAAASQGCAVHFEVKSRLAEGTWFEIHVYAREGRLEVYSRDITQRKQVEEQLRALNETLEQRVAERTILAESRAAQLRDLAMQLIRAEEKERRRVANILHDHFQQLLAAAKFRVGLVRRHPERPAGEALENIEEALAEAIRVSRSLTVELCPPILYDVGLVQALHWLARWMQDRHGLQVNVSGDLASEPPDQDVQVMLFHAVRELLLNVVKHAGVTVAALEMSQQDGHPRIVVADDGAGFDLSHCLSQQSGTAGYGLFSLRERVGQLGGRLEIDTGPGKGTRVSLVVPAAAGGTR